MSEIASKQQLRMAYLRWAVVTVPLLLLLGFASARLVPTGSRNAWYAALIKPTRMIPDAAFPVAWTVIYTLLGLALAIIINARGSRLRGPAIIAFLLQLIVNLSWSPLFFGAHQVFWGMIVIMIMFVLALATTLLFGKVRSAAAWLLVPYLAWLVAAGMLMFELGRLNPNAETLVPSSGTTQVTFGPRTS